MNCCASSNRDTGRLFSRLAGLYRWRYRLTGLERTQRQVLDGVCRSIEGATILEVGCGSGELQRTLLRAGAARAVGVDLSGGLLAVARAEAEAAGLAGRTDYREGDFTGMADALPDSDLVILDKVVCCYPDWENLIDRSAAKTRRLLALTYPRDRALTRLGVRAMGWGLHRFGCCYQPYLHDPDAIAARLQHNGLRRVYMARTTTWLTEVYARPEAANGHGDQRHPRP
jgi:magnesium-protoporphyrin O-methyltransferase